MIYNNTDLLSLPNELKELILFNSNWICRYKLNILCSSLKETFSRINKVHRILDPLMQIITEESSTLSEIEWAISHFKIKISSMSFKLGIARFSHSIEILLLYCKDSSRLQAITIFIRACGNDVEFIKSLLELWPYIKDEEIDERCIEKAISKGNVACFQYLDQMGFKMPKDILLLIVESGGNIPCLEYLYLHHRSLFDKELTYRVIMVAAKYSKVDFIKYLIPRMRDTETIWSHEIYAQTATHDNIDCLRFLYEKVKSDNRCCKWNGTLYRAAVFNNSIDCFKYAYEHGCPFDPYTEVELLRIFQENTSRFEDKGPELECYRFFRDMVKRKTARSSNIN